MKKILFIGLILSITSLQINAAEFTCNSNSYLFTSNQTANETAVFNINMKDANVSFIKTFATSHINATGYNIKDNYIYGWEYGEGSNYGTYGSVLHDPHLVKIDADFNIERVNLTGSLSKTRFYLGDIDKNGIFYLANRYYPYKKPDNRYEYSYLKEIEKIDLNTKSVLSKLTLDYPLDATKIVASDFAINPKDNQLYTINADNNQLVQVNTSNGKVKELGYVGNIGNTYSVINFFDKDGNFYFYAKGDKKIYKIDISNPNSINASAKPFTEELVGMVNSGNGARCANASIVEVPEAVPSTPFVCETAGTILYTSATTRRDSDTSYYTINLSDGTNTTGEIIHENQINAIGYNINDNLVWGWDRAKEKVVRIDANKSVVSYSIQGLSGTGFSVGDVSSAGILYMSSYKPGVIKRVDVLKESQNYLKKLSDITLTKQDMVLGDFAFNPKDGMLYTINENDAKLYTIDPDGAHAGTVTPLGSTGLETVDTHSVLFDNHGDLYFYGKSGQVYKIAVSKNQTNAYPFTTTVKKPRGDGARCSNASVEKPYTPFTCNDTMYFSNMYDLTSDTKTNGKMYLHSINREQSPFTFSKIGEGYHVEGANDNSYYNALAYNPEDNFLYATVKNRLLKIDKNGVVQDLGIIPGLPNIQHFAGTFGHVEADGTAYYYLTQMHEKQIYKIDVKRKTIKETIVMDEAIFTVDMTIDETGENLYFMNRPVFNAPSPNQLMKLNIASKSVIAIGKAVEGESLAGSTFCDATGRVFVIYDEGGFYEIDTTTGERKPISDAPMMAYLNDGAMCSGATVKLKPVLTIGDASVIEGDSGEKDMVFHVSWDKRAGGVVGFKYKAVDGNDTNSKLNTKISDDYEWANYNGESFTTEIVTEGDTKSWDLRIPIIGDTIVEADETFHLILSEIRGALYHNSSLVATGTIIDNDKPKGVCYATTDNYDKLFIYDDLYKTDDLSFPRVVDLNDTLRGGEGGGYRAIDGYMYVFYNVKNSNKWDLKRIDTKTGEITTAKEGILEGEKVHVDAAEFFYDTEQKTDILYVTDKHEKKFYSINTSDWSIIKVKDIIGSENQEVKIGALAIDPYSGEIYATQDAGGLTGTGGENPILFSLDITGDTVVASKLFTLPHVDAEGLAFANDGKLYLETEEVGSGDDEYKIYRVNLTTQTLTKVAHTGTKGLVTTDNNSSHSYVDIETLSCDGGVYQAPAIFHIEQKELVVLEGTPQDINKTKELSATDVNITIVSNRVIQEDEDIHVVVKTIDDTARLSSDYIKFTNQEFTMPVGEKQLKISDQLIQADFLAEKDEYFTCEFSIKDDKASFENGENNVTVTIKDDDKNSFDAWDDNNANLNNRVIRTEIVGQEFTLLFAKINPAGKQLNMAVNFGDESNTSYRVIDKTLCGSEYNVDAFTPFSFSANSTPVTMTVNQAIKEAKVQFYWKDQNGTAKTACSSDTFSIRPYEYNISIGSSIISGKDFNLTIKAVDVSGALVTSYDENSTVYSIDANDTKALQGCSFGKFSTENKFNFTNGVAKITLNYNDIGNLKFKVYENNNSITEFTQVDESDGLGANSRFIGSADIEKSISAAKFTSSFSYKTKNTKAYTYYSQNPNIMGASIDINVSVQNQNNKVVKNFKQGCYAKDVNIKLEYEQVGDTSDATFVDENTTYPSGASVVSGTPKKLMLKVDKRYFDDGNATKKVYMNFGRDKSIAKVPLKVNFTKESSKILGLSDVTKDIDKDIFFIYARAHVQNEIEVVGNTLNAPIKYEVYLPSGIVASDYGLDNNLAKSVDDRRWSVLPSNGIYLDVDATTLKYPKTGVAISNTATSIQVTADKTPHKNRAKYKAKEYLKTDIDSFILTLQSPENQWSGKGKEGKIFDDSASRKTVKRLNW